MSKSRALKNVSYTVESNLLSFLISAMVTFFVPRYIGTESYGYFQLYIFYSSYVGFLHFGWADGLYLRYGGDYYNQLDRSKISGQFWYNAAFEIILSIIVCVVGIRLTASGEKTTVIMFTSFAISIIISRTFLQYVLQCTNRIRDYSRTVIAERGVYFIIVIILIIIGTQKFYLFILADIVGKLAALVLTIYYCIDVVFCKPEPLITAANEIATNISVGIKLMLSNIASMLIIGIVRYSIEYHWDVATFGKVSLSLSVSNMLMVFVNAVALVMFPLLRRMDENRYAEIYDRIRSLLMIILFAMLVLYYPIRSILSVWLPQYADSLKYMALLFPICVFESKNSMLIATYMKTLRQEKKLLAVNVITMLLSMGATWITIFRLRNLNLAILAIVILVAFRCILAESQVSKLLDIRIAKVTIIECLMVSIFIYTSWEIGGIKGMLIYVSFYVLYITINRKKAKDIVNYLNAQRRNQ